MSLGDIDVLRIPRWRWMVGQLLLIGGWKRRPAPTRASGSHA